MNNEILPQVNSKEFLPPISVWQRMGGLCLVGSVGAVFMLAAITKYNVTVKASGIVRPTGELRIVEAGKEGMVKEIKVTENQVVQKGEAIAILDDSRLQTQKNQLEFAMEQWQQQFTQINAQILALENQISAETQRHELVVTKAEAELRQRQREYEDQKANSSASVEEATANLSIALQTLAKAQAELKSQAASLKAAQASLSAAKSRWERYQGIVAAGALSQNQFEEAELDVAQQQQAVEAAKALIEAQKKEIERQFFTVEAAKAQLLQAETGVNPSNELVTIASNTIGEEKATGKAIIANLNREKQALIQQRIEIEKQLDRDLNELEKVKLEMQQTTILAPTDGTILQLNLRNPQQTVGAGEKIAQIAPSHSPLIVKTYINAQDIARLKIGQIAQVQISACPYPDYGTLDGIVTEISSDIIVNEANRFYEVTIQPDRLVLGDCVILAGMEGIVNIITQKETVLKFILRKARLFTNSR
ncbi:MAG: HlyD family efflux transporter periplasmic adaptor subunit [Gomphosphaeria aponina SAG 52.96 = DSM 107014]|uniref:HlyD family efflux transporter periplasmic adaptor subunit n=1 Tax=Gomphosphaeria aponina SAG 52.96 = DSM 107014 TaxID=1521640 RepID=A0A941JPP9_9CHRO|nr:HlyD family efflux transporter periplasmic adaptor subunit [Gomphosphaeria aponina SAG 52.96 = DSM 107014]